jgi:hypothetical protein
MLATPLDDPVLTEQPLTRPHRRGPYVVIAALVAMCLVIAGVALAREDSPRHPAAPPLTDGSTAVATVTALQTPGFGFGFYSAGLRLVDCFGSCRPGTKEYVMQQADRARMTQLQAMGVTFVTNNESIVHAYRRDATAVLTYLKELHAHKIRVSYAVASGRGIWFPHGKFTATQAAATFARTDLNHDGVSDLDGQLDVVYQGHEVLEWATHAQRVQMYRLAKHWFPHTPIAVYYAGINRPVDPAWANVRHSGGAGGTWSDYAYGAGETDIALVNVRKGAAPATLDNVDDYNGSFVPADFAAAARISVADITSRTPHTPVFVSTNIAGDEQMSANPRAMWSAADLRAWYDALVAIPGVEGVQLRSYGRFTYDLANQRFTQQQATWRALGSLAARIETRGTTP